MAFLSGMCREMHFLSGESFCFTSSQVDLSLLHPLRGGGDGSKRVESAGAGHERRKAQTVMILTIRGTVLGTVWKVQRHMWVSGSI